MLHGFAGREEGQVWIKATEAHDHITLVIADNGQGVAEDFDASRHGNLGMEVVRRLGEQELGGRVTLGPNPEGGARTVVHVPL